jgi:hypothetical protein
VRRKGIFDRLRKSDKSYKTPLCAVMKLELSQVDKKELKIAKTCAHTLEDLLRAVEKNSRVHHSSTRIVNKTMQKRIDEQLKLKRRKKRMQKRFEKRDQYIKEEHKPLVRDQDEEGNLIWVPSEMNV